MASGGSLTPPATLGSGRAMKLLEIDQEDGLNLVILKVNDDSLNGKHQAVLRTDESGYIVMLSESFVASFMYMQDFIPSEEQWTMLSLWAVDFALRNT